MQPRLHEEAVAQMFVIRIVIVIMTGQHKLDFPYKMVQEHGARFLCNAVVFITNGTLTVFRTKCP